MHVILETELKKLEIEPSKDPNFITIFCQNFFYNSTGRLEIKMERFRDIFCEWEKLVMLVGYEVR